MALTQGTRLGPYVVAAQIGAGGMGEVYRAEDTNLKRHVAIKVLPQAVALDTERIARFQREAEVLATLNHPNIAAIYGLERADGQTALVMELVEGPTLADRLVDGAIPLDEALPIAKQIAEALEAAHEHGIIHRDLKPANVKVRPDGTVKVLDFGLAKAMVSVAAAASTASLSPTITTPAMTQAGMIFGTAAYMSPEQARGRPVDKRSDVWAFGVVLYEMLAGARAFEGEDVTEMIAAVVKTTPNWSALPADTPRPILTLIQRCLEKDRKSRVGDIAAARFLLADHAALAVAPDSPPPTPEPRSRWSRTLPWMGAAVLAATAGAAGFLYARQSTTTLDAVRFEISQPPDAPFRDQIQVSPDGRLIAYAAPGGGDARNRLWVRPLDSLRARSLPGTEGTSDGLFWLPDSRTLVFASAGKLRRINVTGGPAQTICDFNLRLGGGFLTEDNRIVFGSPVTGIQACAAGGTGTATPITALAAPGQDTFHAFPSLLPDGQHFLFWRLGRPDSGIYVGSLTAKPEEQTGVRLLPDGSAPVYVPASNGAEGHLLFVRDSTLLAQRFDTTALALVGDAVPVGEDLRNAYGFSASQNGTLVYLTSGSDMQLAWFDRHGKPLGTVGPVGPSADSLPGLRLSPDGTRVALSRSEPGALSDIWIIDLTRGIETRLTTDPSADNGPVWSPDGARIAFSSTRAGAPGLYLRASDGAGSDELVASSRERIVPTDWSPDGRFLLFRALTVTGSLDVAVLPMEPGPGRERTPIPFLRTGANESNAVFSPDGRFVAYESDESGVTEVYVRPFDPENPEASGAGPGKVTVSRNGGTRPQWDLSGKALSYVTADLKRWSVDVSLTPTLRVGEPQLLGEFPRGVATITPDGQRVLIGTPVGSQPQSATVVLNWRAGLK